MVLAVACAIHTRHWSEQNIHIFLINTHEEETQMYNYSLLPSFNEI